MNSLKRDLRHGEEVVVKDEYAPVTGLTDRERVFVCEDGFGMQSGASGTKIFGQWKKDGSRGAIRGEHIDIDATTKLQTKSRLTAGSKA